MKIIFLQVLVFNQNKCDFCGTCVGVCPHDAIELFESALIVDEERCTLCKNCVVVCPARALEIRDEE